MTQRKQRGGTGYLPTLDGWRALAILSVILTHDSLHSWGKFSDRWLYLNGGTGVDLFFAISGILICSRLLEEEHLNGSISLRNFYLRRSFRILPAALVYLLTVAVLGALHILIVYPKEVLSALVFLRNYPRSFGIDTRSPAAWFTSHFWSLSIEEHFYLLLPGLLVLLRHRARSLALACLALCVIGMRGLELMSRPYNQIMFHTEVRLDSLLVPALLALAMRTWPSRYKISAVLRYWPIALAAALVLCGVGVGTFWQTTCIVFLMPMIVLGSVLHANNFLGRFLELAPLRFIGRISYSLYLWQMLFFVGHQYHRTPLGVLERWPGNWIATFTLALASYRFVELPMIRLGHKIAPSSTPGRRDLVDQSSISNAHKAADPGNTGTNETHHALATASAEAGAGPTLQAFQTARGTPPQ